MSKSNTGFQLKSMADINKGMFAPTDPITKPKGEPTYNLPLDKLVPFKGHPFKLYTGQRFEDMVESIKANGVFVPVIVRPFDDNTYEILSGHNRIAGAREAGLETIPAIIREDLSDEEALLIVTETNLIQRSFADLTHSERAVTLSMHHEAIKKQGHRNDLIQEIENMLNASNGAENLTSCPVGTKFDGKQEIGNKYDLSRESVARYLRINKLTEALKTRLDDGELAIRAAVTLSYLSPEEQQILNDVLDSSHYRVDMKKAEALRLSSEKKPLTYEDTEEILAGTKKPKTASARPAPFKLKPKIVTKYFKPEQKPAEIEATIIEALDFFYAHKKQEGEPNQDGGNKIISTDVTAGEALPSEIVNG